jgi:thiol-disulfide isomerase/thioredoxin
LQKENEHLQTNNKEYPTFYGKLGKQFMKDSVAIVCYNNIKKVKDEEISNFIKFVKNNNLHKKYIQYAKNDIDAYYTLLFNNIASYWFFDNTNGKSKVFLTGGWDKVAKGVLKPIVENINKESLKSLYMGSLKNPRFNGFWAYLYDVTPTDEDKTPQAQEVGILYKRFETKLTEVFKGEALEVQMANFISSIEMQKKYEIVLIGMIDRFKQHFPSSVYNESLEKAQKEVQLYHEQKNKPIANDIKVIEKYNDINSFSALLEQFKGKAVLVDLWGTWCGSCKKEFKYLPALKEYFKDKDIVYLYIARENEQPNKEEKWLNMIKFHNLAGYHIIANKELLVDIWKQVATISDEEFANIEEASKETMNHVRSGKLQVYPNYLIVNVKGETVYKSAHHPSTKEKLYKQIESVLAN